MLSFGWFPGVWNLYADVSEHSVCSIFIGRYVRVEWTSLRAVLGYYTGKGLAWKWSEPLGRGWHQRTETNCESFPSYIEAGCVREIWRVGLAGDGRNQTIVSDARESPKRKHTTFISCFIIVDSKSVYWCVTWTTFFIC